MNHEHFLKLAKECSLKSNYSHHRRGQVGCIVVYKGSVLAKGWNSERTHTDQMKFNKYRFQFKDKDFPHKLHAEQMCLSKIKYLDIDFSKVVLYGLVMSWRTCRYFSIGTGNVSVNLLKLRSSSCSVIFLKTSKNNLLNKLIL